MSAADRNWALFLQKLKENETSLKDIADANQDILIGILDDFGFGHLQKGQILTRFKSEVTAAPPSASAPAPAPASSSAPAPSSASKPRSTPSQGADASLKTWLQSLKLEFLEKELVTLGCRFLNDVKKLNETQVSQILSHSEMRLGHRKRFQRELGLLKHAETEKDLKNLTVFFSDEEEGEMDFALPRNASSNKGEYISPRVARPSAPSEDKSQGSFVAPVSRLAQSFAASAAAPPHPAPAAAISRDEIETSLTIPQPAIPFVWGKRADNVNSLQRQFGVKIDKDKQWEETRPSRKVTIRGPTEGVNQAKREIESIIKEIRNKSTVTYFPANVVGALIGKGGSNIRKLEADFGVHIHAETENPQKLGTHYDIARVEIVGNEADALKMKKMIAKLEFEELIDHFERKEDSLKLYYYPMLVEDAIAFLIGRDGDRLRYLQHQSGTLIEVKDDGERRLVIVTGLPDGVEKAKKSLNLALEEFEEERKFKREPIQNFVSEKTSNLKVSTPEAIFLSFQDREFSKIPNIRISIYYSKAYSGEVVIEGKAQEVDQAIESFKAYLKEFEQTQKDKQGTSFFTAPEDARGAVIGRAGVSLRKISLASHVEANFFVDEEGGSYVSLTGYPFQIQYALELMVAKISSNNRRFNEKMGAEGFGPITEEAEVARLVAASAKRKKTVPSSSSAAAAPAATAEEAPAENGAHEKAASVPPADEAKAEAEVEAEAEAPSPPANEDAPAE